ncbi:MAG: transglycosylase SLT domain-containing protein [Smithellaceae bacterium]
MKYKYGVMAIMSAFMLFTASAGAQDFLGNVEQPAGQALINALKIDQPLTFCGEPVPLNEPEIKERLERELLYVLDNNSNIILWLKRSNRYFSHIEKVLEKNSMPDDLKYIAIAESALKPLATSNKGAVGYWQFIEGTGTRYGMEINSDIDERRNFFTSTEAAIAYLKDLYALFGSWTLAAAAYNMGEEGLKAEMLVQKVNNYYQLYLPQETQRYVFRILSAKMIISNPKKYGYFLPKEDLYQPLQFDRIEISNNQPVPIYLIAQAAKTYFKVIKDINPHIRNYYIPAGKHQLLIPKGTAAGFGERYDNLLQQWLVQKKECAYTIKKGDNLPNIAARFNIPVKAIKIWNGITNGKKLVPGDKLIIYSKNFTPKNNNGKDSPQETH